MPTSCRPRIEPLIVGCKRYRPHWGAHKSRELLVRHLNGDIGIPAKSTVDTVLHRHGLAGILAGHAAGPLERRYR
jgi:hypothetical protein